MCYQLEIYVTSQLGIRFVRSHHSASYLTSITSKNNLKTHGTHYSYICITEIANTTKRIYKNHLNIYKYIYVYIDIVHLHIVKRKSVKLFKLSLTRLWKFAICIYLTRVRRYYRTPTEPLTNIFTIPFVNKVH